LLYTNQIKQTENDRNPEATLSCSAVPAIETTLLLSVMDKEQITRVGVGSAASFLSFITMCELKTSVLNGIVIVEDVWDCGLK